MSGKQQHTATSMSQYILHHYGSMPYHKQDKGHIA
jgi:hypothetical protein